MPQNYGISKPAPHVQPPSQLPARYLVLIESGSGRVARLYLPDHSQVAEFSAGSEEAAALMRDAKPAGAPDGAEWNDALQGHSGEERSAAEVYTLPL